MITQREITTHETLTPVKAVIYEDSDTAAKHISFIFTAEDFCTVLHAICRFLISVLLPPQVSASFHMNTLWLRHHAWTL